MVPDLVKALGDFVEAAHTPSFTDVEKAQAALDSLGDFLSAHRRLRDEHILEPDAVQHSAAAAERFREQLKVLSQLVANPQRERKATYRK